MHHKHLIELYLKITSKVQGISDGSYERFKCYHSSKWICNPFLGAQLTIARAQVVASLSLSLPLTIEMAISVQRRGEP
jgi:hypothetical protein